MMNGLNSFYPDTIEDQILENYVALWRHVNGDRRLKVSKKIPKGLPSRNCKMCQQEFQPRSANAGYCGDRRNGSGCAYKTLSLAGQIGGKKVQMMKKYKHLKKLWEQEE